LGDNLSFPHTIQILQSKSKLERKSRSDSGMLCVNWLSNA
jgi:hypothetical protein